MLSLLVLSLSLNASYELADLKALEKQQSWTELLEHLEDISPSKRDKEWEGLGERAAIGWMSALELKADSAQWQLASIEALMKRYPFLKASKPFMQKRLDVAVKGYLMSYSNFRHSAGNDEWMDKIKAHAESDTVTPDAPLRLAKEVVLQRLIPVTAFPLYKLASDRGNKTLCRDGDFHKVLAATFEEGSWKKEAEDLAGKCWDDVKGPLVAALEKAQTNKLRRNLCPVLDAKKALPASQKKACEEAQ
jgi:hypothetical protein